MIDKLVNLVRQNAGDEIVRNPAIPDQHNEEAMHEVGKEINDGLEQEAKQGNLQNLISMFKGNMGTGLSSNPVTKSVISRVAGKLAARFGVAPDTASSIAATVVPRVLNQFINKANDPNDKEFDFQDALRKFSGNSNIADLMGQLGGGSGGEKKSGLGETIGGFFNKK